MQITNRNGARLFLKFYLIILDPELFTISQKPGTIYPRAFSVAAPTLVETISP